MSDFASVLRDARQLPQEDLFRLLTTLWGDLPAESTLPLDPERPAELERRWSEIQNGPAKLIP